MTALIIVLYALIGFQHARVWTRDALKGRDDGMIGPIWLLGFPLWPLIDAIWLTITFCEKFPNLTKRLVVAAPALSERKELKRKELEQRVKDRDKRIADLEAELEL